MVKLWLCRLHVKMDTVYSQVRTHQRANIAWDVTSLLGGLSKCYPKVSEVVGKDKKGRWGSCVSDT